MRTNRTFKIKSIKINRLVSRRPPFNVLPTGSSLLPDLNYKSLALEAAANGLINASRLSGFFPLFPVPVTFRILFVPKFELIQEETFSISRLLVIKTASIFYPLQYKLTFFQSFCLLISDAVQRSCCCCNYSTTSWLSFNLNFSLFHRECTSVVRVVAQFREGRAGGERGNE